MPSIVFSPKAVEDLDGIKAYIETELGSPKAANEKLIEILDAIDNLAVFPEIGHSLRGKVNSLTKYLLHKLNFHTIPASEKCCEYADLLKFSPY